MRTDYFADLIVPGVPGTKIQTGDGSKPLQAGVSPVSPVSPVKNIEADANTFPAWCLSDCRYLEFINLPGSGQTPGCVLLRKGHDNTWRRLNKMNACPRRYTGDVNVPGVMGRMTWSPGNPFTCSCGHSTGWRMDGKPMCPACVIPENPDQYRRDMLASADELEQAALATSDPEKREMMLRVVTALRKEVK